MSPNQKFQSLVVLLLSISTIILTPTVLDTFSTNEDEYRKIAERCEKRNIEQYKLITTFQDEIDNLNIKLQKQSSDCTRKIVQRDSYWTEQIKFIRGMVSKLERNDKMIYGSDTLEINPDEKDLNVKKKALQNMDYLIYKNKSR